MSENADSGRGAAQAGRVPRSTYRIQFNHHFTFQDATAIVPYLRALGVSDLYASPYLQARPGSLHGYDISSHERLNPEIGSEADHARMSAALAEHGMGQLVDIVPNHMGIGPENHWWVDVLEHGPSSPFAPFFDIDWDANKEGLRGKVLLPVLGDQYGRVLERGELRLEADDDGGFHIRYFEHLFPASPRSTAAVMREALEHLQGAAEEEARMELESIADTLEGLPVRSRTEPEAVARRRRERAVSRRRVRALLDASPAARTAMQRAVEVFNGDPGDARSFDRLDALLDDQAYRLAYWRVAAEEINYRRFFDVNDLAGLRTERGEVFEATHRLILRLVRGGKVDGLRIDHPDGLYDPAGYLRQLQHQAALQEREAPFYVLVEKILTGDETLPGEWPVAGTVGYEFLNWVSGLFVARENEERFDNLYRRFARLRPAFDDLVHEKKRLILRASLVSELAVLSSLLSRLSEAQRRFRDFTSGSLRDALRETIAAFPVYRTYIDAEAGLVTPRDRAYVERAVRVARRRNPQTPADIFHFIRDVLLLRWPETLDEQGRADHARFVMKFQQLTGPVMAKGVEDTTFYVFNRLASLNEVGGEPHHFGVEVAEFHRLNRARAAQWPHAMNASSTHDTKRSEDVRARIHVLSELPDLWEQHLQHWAWLNAERKPASEEGEPIPDPNDEYLLYQTLLGAWPMDPMEAEEHAAFVERIQRYMDKATREAKVHTSWINPNEEYDAGLKEFVARLLDPAPENLFLASFRAFQPTVARFGMLNALGQTLIKLTAPGVPDVYQGQELWDFSLVDPDNRRPVDYPLRERLLGELDRALEDGDRAALARELAAEWDDGRVKLYLTATALRLREALPDLFRDGEYVPLAGAGTCGAHLVAFAREGGGTATVTVVPRLLASMMRGRGLAIPTPDCWMGTWVEGPATTLGGRWRNVLTGAEVEAAAGAEEGTVRLDAEALFADFPVALLERVGAA